MSNVADNIRHSAGAASRVVSAQSGSADAIAADNIRQEEARYQGIYRPVNQDLIEELGRNTLLEAAKDEASNIDNTAKTLARTKRAVGRQGGQITGHQASRIKDVVTLQDAQDKSFTLDNARFRQREFNDTLRTELINTGRGISSSGTSGLQTAANSEAQRNAANANAKAQQKASTFQAIGTGLGLAAMVFL